MANMEYSSSSPDPADRTNVQPKKIDVSRTHTPWLTGKYDSQFQQNASVDHSSNSIEPKPTVTTRDPYAVHDDAAFQTRLAESNKEHGTDLEGWTKIAGELEKKLALLHSGSKTKEGGGNGAVTCDAPAMTTTTTTTTTPGDWPRSTPSHSPRTTPSPPPSPSPAKPADPSITPTQCTKPKPAATAPLHAPLAAFVEARLRNETLADDLSLARHYIKLLEQQVEQEKRWQSEWCTAGTSGGGEVDVVVADKRGQ
jgi:hypothetical protein